MSDVSAAIGRQVGTNDETVVGSLIVQFIRGNEKALGIDVSQLGMFRAEQITPDLWQISAPQEVGGLPVRRARILASVSHGNLVLLGTETWSSVRSSPHARGNRARAG